MKHSVTAGARESDLEINSFHVLEQSIWVFLYMLLEYLSFLFGSRRVKWTTVRPSISYKLNSSNSSLTPAQGKQAALKDLALYWRVQMSDVSVSHSEADTLEVLRTLKSNTERIRLEMDW